MPDPLTLSVALIPIAQNLFSEGIVRGIDEVLRRTPVHKAVRSTTGKFHTRCSNLQAALERWVNSEAFKNELENLGGGQLGKTDPEHVDLFIVETGLQHGAVTFETARDVLVFLYSELYVELCASDEGPKVIGAQIMAISKGVERILDRLPHESAGLGDIANMRYSPRPALDTESRAVSKEDAEAEIQLDQIRQLVNKRQGRPALQLLANLEPKIDTGVLSASVRARYFINKGVCHVICGDIELGRQDFERGRLLDPKNPKATINLAQVALRRKDYAGALDLAERALVTDPKDGNVCSIQLACFHALGRTGELESLLSSHPWLLDESACLYTLAYIAFTEGRFEEAEHYLRRHNEKEPKYAEAWGLLGSSILVPAQKIVMEQAASPNWIADQIRDRITEAEVCFCKEEQLLSGCDSGQVLAVTYTNRGVSRMLLSRFDEGRRDFERALEIDPSLDEVRRNIGSLYLHLDRAEEAIKVFDEIKDETVRENVALQRAAAYLNAGKPVEARRLLEARLERKSVPDEVLLSDLLLVALHRLRDSQSYEARAQWLESLAEKDPEASRVLAQHRLRTGDKAGAIATMRRAVEVAPEPRRSRYRLFLAEMHYRLGQYSESADQYEIVSVRSDDSADTRRYLGALYASGRLSKALQLARAVRGVRTAVQDFSEIEALVLESSGDLPGANKLRRALLDKEVTPARQRIKIAANLVRLGQQDSAKSLVTAVSLHEIADDPDLLSESARLRTILDLPDALKYAYQLLRVEFGDPGAHLFYIKTFSRRETIDRSLFHPQTVVPHCSVLVLRGSDLQRYTLVEGEGNGALNHLEKSHPLTASLLGKSVGERFLYPRKSQAAAEYEVVQIQSEYVFAFQDCLSHFNERFPSHAGLTRIEINPNDPTNIVLMLDARRAHSEKVLELYNAGSLPACTLARLLGRSDAETFFALISDSATRVRSFLGSRLDFLEELGQIGIASSALVESSALVTLESLGLLAKLKQRFANVQVTQQTLDAIVETSMDIEPEKQTGTMFSDRPGHVQVVEHCEGEVRTRQMFYERIVEFLRSSAEVIMPTPGHALSEYERNDLQTTLGAAAASTVCAASASGTLMYSDDQVLRSAARNGHQVRSFPTQTLLQDLATKGIISADEYHRALLRLVEFQFYFVSVNKHDLVWAIREASWKPTPEVRRMTGLLAGPDCAEDDAVNVSLDVLHEVWGEAPLRESKLVLLDLFIQVLLTGRKGSSLLQTLLYRNARRSLIWTPATGEIERGIRGWVFARSRGLFPDAPPEGLVRTT